ncbi:MAG TPA: EthD domain-containing protein [Kribbella sp.]|nr:EthD domain-containing protein [Amycolatopsis sp.]HWD77775.1 EthD domain-containing protein [Kribbella sp.]
MAKHLLLVFADPEPGREAEFTEWYDNTHLPDVLRVPGFRAAQRFAARKGMRGEQPEHRYAAFYEIDTDDLDGALAALRSAITGMQMSDALAPTLVTHAYSAITDRVEAADAESV